MSSIPLYKAFIEVGASEDSASKAAEDVIQVSQLEQLATKADLMATKSELLAKIDLMATKSELLATKSELMAKIDLMATKSELMATKSELLAKMATKSELAATRADIGRLEINMAKQETRLIKWMVSLQLATLVMIATFIKFL